MSTLAITEQAIVDRLAAATLNSQPLFATVASASGPVNAAMQQAIMREHLPAAYVVFNSEKLSPETVSTERGPRFSVLLADRALRQGANPRGGDTPSPGLYALLEQVRTLLDSYAPAGQNFTVTPVSQNAVAADARSAILQVIYEARPI